MTCWPRRESAADTCLVSSPGCPQPLALPSLPVLLGDVHEYCGPVEVGCRCQSLRPTPLRPPVGRRVDPWLRVPPDRHVGRVLRIAHLQEREQIEVMPCEPVEVLEEELQLLPRQRLIVSLVAHSLTIRATATRLSLLPDGKPTPASFGIRQSSCRSPLATYGPKARCTFQIEHMSPSPARSGDVGRATPMSRTPTPRAGPAPRAPLSARRRNGSVGKPARLGRQVLPGLYVAVTLGPNPGHRVLGIRPQLRDSTGPRRQDRLVPRH